MAFGECNLHTRLLSAGNLLKKKSVFNVIKMNVGETGRGKRKWCTRRFLEDSSDVEV